MSQDKRHCICGGNIESTLRENAVWFQVADRIQDIVGVQLPDIKGPVIVAVLPVVK